MLRRLFRKEPKLPPCDLSVLGTDVHSHFIPGIDDGAKTIEESVELIAHFAEFGYKKVVTTPHVMSDYYRNTPEIILGGLEDVRKAVKEAGMDIEVDAAAEYMIDYDFEKSIPNKDLLTIGDGYVLFELPFMAEPPNLNSVIFELQTNGYKPILAHVERYGFWNEKSDTYKDLYEKGVTIQLNIGSITGHYGPEAKKAAEFLIDNDMVGLVGSDCHHLGHIELMSLASTLPRFHTLVERDHLLNKKL